MAQRIIFLDTNYLIRALVVGTKESSTLSAWLKSGIGLITSSIVWYEFCTGPVDARGLHLAKVLLTEGICDFNTHQAATAAELYNAVGRKRHLRFDTLIAASSMVLNAELATANREDFENFIAHGLRLA